MRRDASRYFLRSGAARFIDISMARVATPYRVKREDALARYYV
jgi:hypothetical protein